MEIVELEICCTKLEETRHFYQDVLELPLLDQDVDTLSFQVGETRLVFRQNENLQPNYHLAFNIPNNKLRDAINWLVVKLDLIPIDGHHLIADFPNWNAKSIYFNDNDGNILECIARFDLDNATDRNFDSSSLLSVSEIGIVSENPNALADKLIEENNCSRFSKSPRSELFATIGNDTGLLLLVKTGRQWFPSQQPAKISPVELKLKIGNQIQEISFNQEQKELA